ncbi:50S ribosomal protein L10 [Campylobacter geochelonis]|uniref:Large ribosomal subunit protein uL10 n=1 Tax=Campylobacter geochelonis TaxID=1780362 RepID=A0A128EES3_9BACT|nr:50S ribosomal protein L10 [Campylobacter geochelonis]QKF70823.1 50S ribosomal protein L10 [Campylobacter geochelonis]CZE47420.1 50S ribosomal protein L10 [Campylobacter geochelonis]CZE48067.1 50S ribosomal protein L10 [Campylobacter geochelonis]CZE50592.1 50S ribosomal protein L10 [Campylobacter geochelonis]
MTRDDKYALVSKLTEDFSNSEGIVVSEFKGLSVKKLEELRKLAKEQDVKVQVIKNTLANIALKNANKEGMELKDTNIFIWGEQLAVTKVAAKFEEKNEFFVIKTAHIDGEVCGVDKVKALSKMPSRDELIAMLLQVWNAPIQNFTIGLNALKEKKEQTA